jgi:hypothetical protein
MPLLKLKKLIPNNLGESDRLRINIWMAKSYYLLGERNKALRY